MERRANRSTSTPIPQSNLAPTNRIVAEPLEGNEMVAWLVTSQQWMA